MGSPALRRIRLFLDSGVIVGGCVTPLSASRGVLILTAQTPNFTVVLAEAVDQEVRRSIARRVAPLDSYQAQQIMQSLSDWRRQVDLEWCPSPSEEVLAAHKAIILPVLRHLNDLPAVVSAIQARPDWVLSSNTEHWNQALADRTGLRIATPWEFLRHFYPS